VYYGKNHCLLSKNIDIAKQCRRAGGWGQSNRQKIERHSKRDNASKRGAWVGYMRALNADDSLVPFDVPGSVVPGFVASPTKILRCEDILLRMLEQIIHATILPSYEQYIYDMYDL